METKIEFYEYKKEFVEQCHTGWGCGYVLIPENHPYMAKALICEEESGMLQVDGFDEEITFCERIKDNYLKIGFDTAHRWNDYYNDEEWVILKANHMKDIIDNYTIEDAKKEVKEYVNKITEKFNKYL